MKKAAVDCAGQPDTFRFRRDTSHQRWHGEENFQSGNQAGSEFFTCHRGQRVSKRCGRRLNVPERSMRIIRLKLAELYELEGDSPVPQPGTGDIERLVMRRYGLPNGFIIAPYWARVMPFWPLASRCSRSNAL